MIISTIAEISVPMKKEADTGVLPAHVENGGDTSGTRWLSDAGRLLPFSGLLSSPGCATNPVGS